MIIPGGHLLIVAVALVGVTCLCGSYTTLRKGKGLASFALLFSGLLSLLIVFFVFTITYSMPD